MKPRRRKGATLGLVAVSVLVIILIGVGCFFLAKIAGGGREVANATDAGALQIAKANLRSRAASVPGPVAGPFGYADFMGCGDALASGQITLFTYNRAVAQALIVALNAQQEGTAGATSYANTLWDELTTVGQNLSGVLQNRSTTSGVFTNVANSNSTKMFNTTAVNESDYQWAYMRPGGSTNVWFSQYTFANSGVDASGNAISYSFAQPAGLVTAGTVEYQAPATRVGGFSEYSPYRDLGVTGDQGNRAVNDKFMAGYQVIGPVLGHSFIGVPVFPSQKPHLVSLREFQDPAQTFADPNNFAPPNAYKVSTSAQDGKTNSIGGAVACAIVGAVNLVGGGTQSCDFVAEFPYGYLCISNAPPFGGGPPNWNVPDNSNSIFNWELNPIGGPNPTQGGMAISPGNGGDVFFADSGSAPTTVQQWVDFNQAQQAQGYPGPSATSWTDSGTGSAMTGPPTGSLAGVYFSADGTAQRPASSADLQGTGPGNPGIMSNAQNCLNDLVANNWDVPPLGTRCANNLNAMGAAMGRTPLDPNGSGVPNADMGRYWSAVDYVKQRIIAAMGARSVSVSLPAGTSNGLGEYRPGPPAASAQHEAWNGGSPPPLEKNSTVYDLLTEVGGCATSQVLSDIWQRCNEIAPGTSYNDVVALLSSPSAQLGMGGMLFIQRQNPTDSSSQLTISSLAPRFLSGGVPTADGDTTGGDAVCQNSPYDVYAGGNSVINSYGDAGVGKPFPRGGSSITVTDHAKFVLSSGNHGLLGRLDFSQTSQGTATFSRPN